MDKDPLPTASRRWARGLTSLLVLFLAAIGLCSLVGGLVTRLLLAPTYDTQVTRRVFAHDRSAVSEVEVTKGGFGTVWTTSVNLRPVGQKGWTVYEAQDSDFTPSIKWKGNDTLIIGLPCARVDYLSNPDDWPRSNTAERRFKVRFEYLQNCDAPTGGTTQRPL